MRVEIFEAVLKHDPTAGLLKSAPYAAVQVNRRGGGPAPVYSGPTGATVLSSVGALTADAYGRIEGWLEEGSYDLLVSVPPNPMYTQPFEASVPDGVPGAAGDGTTDDTAALQAALTAGGTVRLRRDAVYLTGGLTLPSDTALEIPPTTVLRLKNGANATVISATGRDNVGVTGGGAIDCNAANQTAGNGIVLTDCTNFRVADVSVINAWNAGIIINGTAVGTCADGRVEGCRITSTTTGHGIALSGESGVFGSGPWRVVVTGNIIRGVDDSAMNVSQASYCTVSNNVVHRSATNDTGYAGVRLSNGSRGCAVVGNTIRNQSRGVFVTPDSGSGPSEYNTISGNYIEGCYYQGILLQAGYCTVADNVIKDCCQGNLDSGIRVAALAAAGVVPATDVLHCAITGNVVIDNAGNKHQYGVKVTQATVTNYVDGNPITSVVAVCDWLTITGNTIKGFVTEALIAAGENTVVRDNPNDQLNSRPAAANLVLYDTSDYFRITGTTTVVAIDPRAERKDRQITLRAVDGFTLAYSDKLRLAGAASFAMGDNDTWTGVWDSESNRWYEVARSVN